MSPPSRAIDRFVANRRSALLRLGALALTLLTVVLPLGHALALRTTFFMLAAACTAFLVLGSPSLRSQKLPLLWVFAVWLAAALLSLTASSDVPSALESIWHEIVKSALVFYVAYFFAKASADENIAFMPAAFSLFILASAVVASWALSGAWQTLGPVPALGDYNTSAITLLPLVSLPLYAHWRQKLGRYAVIFSALAIVLAFLGAAFSQSRSFWLVAAVMLVVAKLAWDREKGFRWDRSVFAIGAVLCLIALVAYLVARWRGLDLLFFDTRSNIYVPVLKRLASAPFTGFGFGHESSSAWYQTHMVEAGVLHAHNIILSYAEQMGLPGLAALLAIFAGFGRRFFKHLAHPDLFRASIAGIGTAMVTGVFVKNNLDFFFTRHNLLLFFLCCGLLLGILEADDPRRTGRNAR